MFFNFFSKIFGTRNSRLLKSFESTIILINSYELSLISLSDDALKLKTNEFKLRIKEKNGNLEELLPEVYAVVREASRRVLGMRHYDVQLLAGIFLYHGKVIEVATGEGKTLIATLPAYLNFLYGHSVHVVTVNDYLAERDYNWMKPLYDFLGVKSGLILFNMKSFDRVNSYKSDVVYGTNNEFCFDYLRDNLCLSIDSKVQYELFYAILDEVDSILIDEARTPLVISSTDNSNNDLYILINDLVKDLKLYDFKTKCGDFLLDEKFKQVQLMEEGFIKLEKLLFNKGVLNNSINLYDPSNIDLLQVVYSCLKANFLFTKDIDYIVNDNKVLIIDEHTGRVMDGRRWSDGLHQAIEAKENVKIQNESYTLASITFQNYFRLYNKLSGMTGTAYTESFEFNDIYNLEVVVIPSNKPCIRIDYPDLVYLTKESKYKAIIKDIRFCVSVGRPVLLGTVSIEVSEYLSFLLNSFKVNHNVLNAKHHEKEAYIISEAGKINSVTIATNMAGRGTDIVLGGKFDFNVTEFEKNEYIKNYNSIISSGGLKVIGSERHESRRIDNQLKGRCARQGDPGASQFYLSLEDNLIRIFIGDRVTLMLNKLSVKEDDVVSHPLITKSIENAQCQLEGHNFSVRKQLLEFDDIINEQRKIIYERRNYLMLKDDVSIIILDILADVLLIFINNKISVDDLVDDNKVVSFLDLLFLDFGVKIIYSDIRLDNFDAFYKSILDFFINIYNGKRIALKSFGVEKFENVLLLNIIDVKWRHHLLNIDHVKKSIHLRGYAQQDPKSEYKKEIFLLFEDMLNEVKYELILFLFKFPIKNIIDNSLYYNVDSNANYSYSCNDLNKSDNIGKINAVQKYKTFFKNDVKIGRNSICYCGSSLKYKKCHGKKD